MKNLLVVILAALISFTAGRMSVKVPTTPSMLQDKVVTVEKKYPRHVCVNGRRKVQQPDGELTPLKSWDGTAMTCKDRIKL